MAQVSNCGDTQNDGVRLKKIHKKVLSVAYFIMTLCTAALFAGLIVISAAVVSWLNMPIAFLWLIVVSGIVFIITMQFVIDAMLKKWEDK